MEEIRFRRIVQIMQRGNLDTLMDYDALTTQATPEQAGAATHCHLKKFVRARRGVEREFGVALRYTGVR